MPSKSVREMSAAERRHFSLSARTFHAIVIICLILSLIAILFGFSLFSLAVRNQFTEKAEGLSKTVASMVDSETVAAYAERVSGIYRNLPAELRADQNSEAYRAEFRDLEDETFFRICEMLEKIRVSNGVTSLYIGIPDDTKENFIFLFNADQSQDFRKMGRSIVLEEKYVNAFDPIATIIPALITRTDDGSYVCTGSETLILPDGRTAGNVVVNFTMNEVARMSTRFLRQYALLMLIATVILAVAAVQHLKKTLVKPVNVLTQAAEDYIADKKKGSFSGSHFRDLSIRTGDEIENLSLIMADMESDIGDYIEDISAVTAEKERISTELSVASQIQEGMLPSIFPPFPERPEVDLYATMHPAKEVGGDFYDFFLIDDDHLAMVIADVSGKGVPAALFMMASKILLSNYSSMDGTSPARILEKVNHSICLSNKADMFVTVWLGILEISSGKLKAANAGHEYPAVQRAREPFALYRDRHGFVVGGIDGARYREYEIMLHPGDSLFLYTDGVTEATNGNNEMFGVERLIDTLNQTLDVHPQRLLENVKSEIDRFVGDAPQFDDITMLGLRYMGQDRKKMTIDAKVENLNKVLAFIDAELEAADCPLKTQMQIDVAVEEIFVNIANYAYAPDTGRAVIGIKIEGEPQCAVITFSDSGIPYNPLERQDPDITIPAEDREIGGLGIFMVKKVMDDMTYAYKNGQNILTIRKVF